MLDVVATRDPTGREYALFVVNRSLAYGVETTVQTNLPAGASGTRSVLTGPLYDSKNDAENPERVSLATTAWTGGGSFTHTFPAASLTIFRWTVPVP
jgi:alpha-L-arabinofuranosidase